MGRNNQAPAACEASMVPSSVYALIISAGMRTPARRISAISSAPLLPGSLKSVTSAVMPPLLDDRQPVFGRRRDRGLEAEPLQDLGDVLGQLDLIVDDEYAAGLHVTDYPHRSLPVNVNIAHRRSSSS